MRALRHSGGLEERFAALEARNEELERRLVALEARAPRDEQDRELRRVLPYTTQERAFKACDLLRHAADVQAADALRHALAAATIQSTAELGAWLRAQRGTRDGVVIERLRRRQWRAYTCDT